MFQKGFLILGALLLTITLEAGETLNSSIYHSYTTPRALGMGETFSGIDDYNVLFYNPAGLTDLEKGEFNFGISAGISSGILKFYKDIKDISDSSKSDADKTQDMSDLLKSKYGDVFSLRVPKLSFIYARQNWGLAFIPVDLSTTIMPHQVVGPALDVTAYQDSTLAFGMGKKYKDGRLSAGFLAKAIYRGNIDKSLLAADLISDSKVVKDNDFKEGMTIDADIGASYKPKEGEGPKFFKYAKPTFNLVVRNIFDYGFKKNMKLYNDKGSELPEKLGRRIDVGSKWEFTDWKVFKPRLLVDFRDILDENFTLIKGLHLGTEFIYDLGYFLKGSLQAGINQGYWTLGAGLQTMMMKFEAVTYAEEYGTKSAKISDRTYMAQFNLNF